jgi:hypothetical protein
MRAADDMIHEVKSAGYADQKKIVVMILTTTDIFL